MSCSAENISDSKCHLISGMKYVYNCPFYWGKMDLFEAKQVLKNQVDGSFLLRDSEFPESLFSVTFKRHSKIWNARIIKMDPQLTFDCYDPSGFLSDPFRSKQLKNPIFRKSPFTLQDLTRAIICDLTNFERVSNLGIPKSLENFLREYHCKHSEKATPVPGSITFKM